MTSLLYSSPPLNEIRAQTRSPEKELWLEARLRVVKSFQIMLLKVSFFFCSCSGAVKKYPKNMMLGQRQVTDGKVKSSLCMFYFDCNLLVLLSEIKLIFIRPVNMCGKRMRKFT